MQHPVERPISARPIVIEVAGEPLGIVIQSATGFRFVAVKLPVFGMDGHIFDSVEAARNAATAAIAAAAA